MVDMARPGHGNPIGPYRVFTGPRICALHNRRIIMSQEDRIAGLLEALEIVKTVLWTHEVRAVGTQLYKVRAVEEQLANGADECRLNILSRIDTIRHGND